LFLQLALLGDIAEDDHAPNDLVCGIAEDTPQSENLRRSASKRS
jgi:hypothetical protein